MHTGTAYRDSIQTLSWARALTGCEPFAGILSMANAGKDTNGSQCAPALTQSQPLLLLHNMLWRAYQNLCCAGSFCALCPARGWTASMVRHRVPVPFQVQLCGKQTSLMVWQPYLATQARSDVLLRQTSHNVNGVGAGVQRIAVLLFGLSFSTDVTALRRA